MALNSAYRMRSLLFIITLVNQDLSPTVAFTSPKVITTAYGTYALYDASVDKSTAESLCTSTGYPLATFTSNVEFQALTAAIDGDADVYSEQFWIDPTNVGSTPYFGSEPVSGASWYPGEPDNSCVGPCCYRIKPRSFFSPIGLADISCTYSFNFACGGYTLTTTTALPTTTTTIPTTSAAETTTTTTPTTTAVETTTTTPTTTTAETTTTTTPTTTAVETTTTATPTTTAVETTTTTNPSTTTAETTTTTTPTTTTAETTTTTAEATTTTTPTTTAIETTTADPTTVASVQNVATLAEDALSGKRNNVRLTLGQQMVLLYLGIVLGGALMLSCMCTSFWVAVNRRRGRVREYPEPESSDDSDLSSSEQGDQEDGQEKGDDRPYGGDEKIKNNMTSKDYYGKLGDESGSNNTALDDVVYSIGGNLDLEQQEPDTGANHMTASEFEHHPNRKWLR